MTQRGRACASAAAHQVLQFLVGEPGAGARFQVERRPQPRRFVAAVQHAVVRDRVETLALAQPAIPAVADGDVADFVAQDDVEDADASSASGVSTRLSLAWISGVASSPRASSVRGTSAMRASTSSFVFSHIAHRPSWPVKSP